MAMMARNIARLTAAPRHRVATYAVMPEAAVEIVPPRAMAPLKAKLSAPPCTPQDLWIEWQFGGAGRKPAKDFNSGK